jgi:hypothetical protein
VETAKELHGSRALAQATWRVLGELEELIDKAKEMAQRTLFGTGFARIFSKK